MVLILKNHSPSLAAHSRHGFEFSALAHFLKSGGKL